MICIDVVVQDDEKEDGYAQDIGKHSKLDIRNHDPEKSSTIWNL